MKEEEKLFKLLKESNEMLRKHEVNINDLKDENWGVLRQIDKLEVKEYYLKKDFFWKHFNLNDNSKPLIVIKIITFLIIMIYGPFFITGGSLIFTIIGLFLACATIFIGNNYLRSKEFELDSICYRINRLNLKIKDNNNELELQKQKIKELDEIINEVTKVLNSKETSDNQLQSLEEKLNNNINSDLPNKGNEISDKVKQRGKKTI